MKSMNNKGVAAVEFAIILPLLVLILFGSIEFGCILYNKQIITNASREGARAGIAGATNIDQITLAYCNKNNDTSAESILINLGGLKHNPSIAVSGPDPDKDLKVTVSYTYDFLFASILGFNQTSLTGETIMRME